MESLAALFSPVTQPFAHLGFDQPWAIVLLPLPLLIWWLLPRAQQQEAALRVPFFHSLATDERVHKQRAVGQRGRLSMLIALWLLLIAAACAPRWIGDPVSLPASGRDLMLAVDLSESMTIPDMLIDNQQVQRVIAVKTVVDDFIAQREGDRIGLILFGTNAYVQSPLTFDRDTVRQFLRESQIGFAGERTAIGDAIGLAAKRLRARPGDRHVLVLLTDGANTAGNVAPTAAAKVAADNHIVIYTVGIGADEMMLPGLFGSSLGARRVNPSADLDETTLRAIADTTGGRYFRARDPKELAEIYRLLDQLEPIADKQQTYRPERSLFFWPLGAALIGSLLWGGAATLRVRHRGGATATWRNPAYRGDAS
jgi:Ca-activated chloride channel family protein